MSNSIAINSHMIGRGFPTYIVAELSANHNQSLDQAVRLVKAAKEAGADAVKLQTYRADTLTIQSDQEYFRVSGGTLWDGRTLYDLYQEAHMPWEWHSILMKNANDLGLDIFSTPFDNTAVDFLEKLEVPAYKIASFELVDLPLIQRVAQTGKPIILSTGMATLAEIDEAVSTARDAGAKAIALLKCNSAYPAPPEAMNLRTIPHMAQAFDTPIGLSDHSLAIAVPVVAVTMGACIIEKHLTLSRSVPGPDSAFSLEPNEFKAMVDAVRVAEKALGKVSYEATEQELPSRMLRRSLFVVRDMRVGEEFTTANIKSIRPGHGLHTRYAQTILGRKATRDIKRGSPLAWDLVG
jgi:N-acetylneuraminate synthase